MIDTAYLIRTAEQEGISLTGETARLLDRYAEELCRVNEYTNLTAITDPEGIANKHFLDSLLLESVYPLPQGASLADVGTGAGFPGLPLKLHRPDIRLCLMDSLGKRITFLTDLCRLLEVESDAIHIRAEDAGKDARFREQFDVVTARAVAALPTLCELCLPLAKVGGVFVAMKGGDPEEELAAAKKGIATLGGKVERVENRALPDGSRRTFVVIRKVSQTPTKYPRSFSKIAKAPL